jgi:hypothetical protein
VTGKRKPPSARFIKRVQEEIAEALLPLVFLSLAKQKILRPEHLGSPLKLLQVLKKNNRQGVKKVKYTVAIDAEFIQEAVAHWKKDQKTVAIVLYAAAVEQYVNQTYSLMLEAHGLQDAEIEKIVRTLNIEPKLSWLLKVVTKKEFPKALAKRLRTVFELRNAIVHFKGIRGELDSNSDSYSKIQTDLKKLKRLSLSRDYRLLTQALWNCALEKDPDLDLAMKATAILDGLDKK